MKYNKLMVLRYLHIHFNPLGTAPVRLLLATDRMLWVIRVGTTMRDNHRSFIVVQVGCFGLSCVHSCQKEGDQNSEFPHTRISVIVWTNFKL